MPEEPAAKRLLITGKCCQNICRKVDICAKMKRLSEEFALTRKYILPRTMRAKEDCDLCENVSNRSIVWTQLEMSRLCLMFGNLTCVISSMYPDHDVTEPTPSGFFSTLIAADEGGERSIDQLKFHTARPLQCFLSNAIKAERGFLLINAGSTTIPVLRYHPFTHPLCAHD